MTDTIAHPGVSRDAWLEARRHHNLADWVKRHDEYAGTTAAQECCQ